MLFPNEVTISFFSPETQLIFCTSCLCSLANHFSLQFLHEASVLPYCICYLPYFWALGLHSYCTLQQLYFLLKYCHSSKSIKSQLSLTSLALGAVLRFHLDQGHCLFSVYLMTLLTVSLVISFALEKCFPVPLHHFQHSVADKIILPIVYISYTFPFHTHTYTHIHLNC